MKASIVSVGTELLFGQTLNTNCAYLSDALNRMGIDVLYHFTVGDNPARLEDVLREGLKRSDLIITTGGLGPTQDDLTKEIVCKVMEEPLELHQPSLDAIKSFFQAVKRPMTDNNVKQAMLPQNGVVFSNDRGTAPGFAVTKKDKTIACLPGPPREMKAMFELSLAPFLADKTNSVIYYQLLRTYGLGESAMETALLDLIDNQTDPTIATYAMEGESYLRVASKADTFEKAKSNVEKTVGQVLQRIGDYVYSTRGQNLVDVVAERLLEKGLTISCAESCTGGMFAAALTDVPGISKIFDRGFVTYSNKAKIEELGVSPATIEKHGAVSPETAKEMVQGVYKATGSDICVSVTGIAGPDGGTEIKPVGLVYIGLLVATEGREPEILVTEHLFRWKNREKNREVTVLAMLHGIYKKLKALEGEHTIG